MEFKLNEFHRNSSDEELIADLKRVATFLKRDTITMDDYNQYGSYHATTLTRRFGSWFTCLEKAGLRMSRSHIGISDEALFEDLERVWVQLGKQPSYTQMRELAQFSIGTYEKRFGGWRGALRAFVDYIYNSSLSDGNSIVIQKVGKEQKAKTHSTQRTINLRLRFLVLQRDHFKCCKCGASPAKDASVELHIDHIIPWSKGGETEINNLQTLCSKCNIGKSNFME